MEPPRSYVLWTLVAAVLLMWLNSGGGCFEPFTHMHVGEPHGKCEGYWSDEHPPVQHPRPWCGKEEFDARLAALEARCEEHDGVEGARFTIGRQRGLAQSWFDMTFLGNEEYYDMERKVCWTGDYRAHYVGKHNVVPSRAFYDYVLGTEPE